MCAANAVAKYDEVEAQLTPKIVAFKAERARLEAEIDIALKLAQNADPVARWAGSLARMQEAATCQEGAAELPGLRCYRGPYCAKPGAPAPLSGCSLRNFNPDMSIAGICVSRREDSIQYAFVSHWRPGLSFPDIATGGQKSGEQLNLEATQSAAAECATRKGFYVSRP